MAARIAAVADVYDALRTSRPYKDAFPHEKAVGIIRESSGSHFDPDVVAVFLHVEKQCADLSAELEDVDRDSYDTEPTTELLDRSACTVNPV